MVTSKVPATKRSMERFLFHVKALLHSTSSNCTFWMGELSCNIMSTCQRIHLIRYYSVFAILTTVAGNLKHKDLSGQAVSSQAYDNGEDDMLQEMEDGDEDNNNNNIGTVQRAIEVEDLGDQQDDD